MTVDALLITIALMVVHSTLLPSFPPSSSRKTPFDKPSLVCSCLVDPYLPPSDPLLYTLAHVIAGTLKAKTSLRTGKLCRTVYQLLLGALPTLEVEIEICL